jgi:LysR family transcriptional regulator, regulator of gene expression of beta-lactamase
MYLPLNALRAFEVSARHLSFTRAASELNLSQAAVAQQVKNLEDRLGLLLFRRLPRGLALTDEGQALLPDVSTAFAGISQALARFQGEDRDVMPTQVLSIAVLSTFAVRWLLPRLADFERAVPWIDLRIYTHNNRVDLASEGFDGAIRWGQGAWHGLDAMPLLQTPLQPMASPAVAERIADAAALRRAPLLRSYRNDEWPQWFAEQGLDAPVLRGPVFDSSLALAEAAVAGLGVALLPRALFAAELDAGRLRSASDHSIVTGRYWLTTLRSRSDTAAMAALRQWLGTDEPSAG